MMQPLHSVHAEPLVTARYHEDNSKPSPRPPGQATVTGVRVNVNPAPSNIWSTSSTLSPIAVRW